VVAESALTYIKKFCSKIVNSLNLNRIFVIICSNCLFLLPDYMLLELLVPSLCFILLLLLISSKRFFKVNSVSKRALLIYFSLKAFSALFFGYFYKTGMLTGSDTYIYFYDGDIVYSAFKTDPFTYFRLALGTNDFLPVPTHLLPYVDDMNFWFDSSNYFLVRINALIRLFSFGIYNVHAVVFAFLSFTGTYNLYLFFEEKVVNKKILQFILFCIPSVVFWTSGVHKEAIVLFALGLILYNVDLFLKGYSKRKNIVFFLIGLILLGYIRLYLLFFLLPLILAVLVYKKFNFKESSFRMFLVSIVIFLFLVLLIDMSTPKISLMREFLIRRAYFLNSPGNMTFQVQGVPTTIQGVISLFWEALINPFIRPLPNDCNIFLSYLASVETVFLLIVLIVLLATVNIRSIFRNPYAIFSILFGFSTLFLIGLIVNNSGAIVRYRSIAIPFILIGLCLKGKDNKELSLSRS